MEKPLKRAADTGFTKLVLSGQYNHLLGEEFVARLKAVTQIADSRLPISELYDLGGPDFGRAFLLATAQGDGALAGSVEIGYLPKGLDGWLKGIELFGFADDGGTWYRARPANLPVDFHLASAGAGFRLPIGAKTKLEIAAADAVATNVPGTKTRRLASAFRPDHGAVSPGFVGLYRFVGQCHHPT